MLTIITPFYNSFSKIDQLVKSISNQTDTDFEWIIIDDHSEKSELLLLESKINLLKINVKLLKNRVNSGPGISRNVGIMNARGDYITFVDSDDYISNDFVEEINKNFTDEIDFLTFDFAKVNGKKIERVSMISKCHSGKIEISNLLKRTLMCVCGAVYLRKKIVENNIVFPELRRYEDFVFKVRYLSKCSSPYYMKKSLYFYVQYDSSVTHSNQNASIFSESALNMIKPDLIFDQSIIELFYVREVIYLKIKENAYSKNIADIISVYDKMFPNWNCMMNTKYLRIVQRIIIFLYKIKAIFLIKIIVRMKN